MSFIGPDRGQSSFVNPGWQNVRPPAAVLSSLPGLKTTDRPQPIAKAVGYSRTSPAGPASSNQRLEAAADFLDVCARVEGGDPEIAFPSRPETGAGGDDDLGLAEHFIEHVP